jgi:hypothetical protein
MDASAEEASRIAQVRKTRQLLQHEDHLDALRRRANSRSLGTEEDTNTAASRSRSRSRDPQDYDETDLKSWTSYLLSRKVNAPSKEQVGARLSRLCEDWQDVGANSSQGGNAERRSDYSADYDYLRARRREKDREMAARTIAALRLEDAVDGMEDDDGMPAAARPSWSQARHRSSIFSPRDPAPLSSRPLSYAPSASRPKSYVGRPMKEGSLTWAKVNAETHWIATHKHEYMHIQTYVKYINIHIRIYVYMYTHKP